jgi:glutamate dehydrogenase/leucine dehydrogenase
LLIPWLIIGTFVDAIGEHKQLPEATSSSAVAPVAATTPAKVASSGRKVLVLGAGYVAGPLVEYLAALGHTITVASLVV